MGDDFVQEDFIQNDYFKFIERKLLIIFLLVCLLVVVIISSISLGASSLTIDESLYAIFSKILPQFVSSSKLAEGIIWKLRVPRVLMGVITGIALAAAGVVMQAILKNPLASPYTLGISSAASFGAALAIVMGTGFLKFFTQGIGYEFLIISNSFIVTLICTFIIYFLTKVQKATSETIILLGVAMMFLFSAGLSFLQYIGDPDELAELAYWMFGSLSKGNWTKLKITAVIIAIILPIFLKWSWEFNALASDDEMAKSLGINVEKIRLKSLLLSSLLTAISTCFLGPIGFIGLVAPHFARMIVGGDHRFMLPVACLVGAILLLFADTVARTIIAPAIIPVGIVTSFIGVPLFIHLMLNRKKEYW